MGLPVHSGTARRPWEDAYDEFMRLWREDDQKAGIRDHKHSVRAIHMIFASGFYAGQEYARKKAEGAG